MSKLKQKRAESPISLQPRATPWVYSIQLTTRPVRATICGTIELPLQGAWFVFVRYPGRCPGLWRNWAFSPHYLHFDTPSTKSAGQLWQGCHTLLLFLHTKNQDSSWLQFHILCKVNLTTRKNVCSLLAVANYLGITLCLHCGSL